MINESRKDAARRKPRWFTPVLLGLAVGGVVGIAATLLLPGSAVHPSASPPASISAVAIDRVPWLDGATNGWVSPDERHVVAKLSDGLGMYEVSGAPGQRRLIIVKRVVVGTDGGKWLEDSSGFVFEGVYGTTLEQRRSAGPFPITFDLDVLETTGSVTHLESNALITTAVFSRLSPDGTMIGIGGPCCPQEVQLLPRSGGAGRELIEGSLIGWDNLGRVLYVTGPGRTGARAVASTSSSYEITVPMPANSIAVTIEAQSISPDRSAVLLQAGRTSAAEQSLFVLLDGRLLQLPQVGAPIGLWAGAHELLLQRPGDHVLFAFDPATGRSRQLPAALDEGASLWRSSGPYLLWQLRGAYRVTDVETGAMRFVDLPNSEVGGADFWVTAPGQFAIVSSVGIAYVDASALMSQPAPSNLLRDRPTVGTTHVPDGLALPPLCRYIDFHDNLSSWDWQIDCGEGTNVRATIAVNLDRAGWSTCKATATDSTLVKGNRELVVTDSRGPQLPISMAETARKTCP